ncbi:MAG: phosphoglycolate phosphatase [Chthoniobacterales bacterium]
MRSFPFDVVVFDLDGTLVHTAPDLVEAVNHMLTQLGRETVPGPRVIEMVGRGMRDLLERALTATGSVTSALVEEAVPIFLQHYDAHIADHSRPYEGAGEALDLLAGRGARLAVCTNKPEALSRKLLASFGWRERFASVVGGDTLAVRKPEAAPLQAAIEQAGGGSAVLVGDSITDVRTAQAVGVPCVATSFGYRDRPAAELGADAVIDRYDQLVGVLEDLQK